MKADPSPETKCRDKFLVQSAPITSDKEFTSIASVLESTDKTQIQERKIRVNWLAANDGHDRPGASQPETVTPNKPSGVNGSAAETPDVSRTYSSPRANVDSAPHSAPPYTSGDVKDEDDKSERPKSAVSQAVSDSTQPTIEELKAKLAQALAENASLKENGLRQRNVKTATGEEKKAGGQTVQAIRRVEGVPVQMVAMLCLLSFLLAYFFF